MSTKDKNKKSIRPKNNKVVWRPPAKVVAEVVGCGETTVRAVRRGDRPDETDLGKSITLADELLEKGTNLLIEEVKKVVNH